VGVKVTLSRGNRERKGGAAGGNWEEEQRNFDGWATPGNKPKEFSPDVTGETRPGSENLRGGQNEKVGNPGSLRLRGRGIGMLLEEVQSKERYQQAIVCQAIVGRKKLSRRSTLRGRVLKTLCGPQGEECQPNKKNGKSQGRNRPFSRNPEKPKNDRREGKLSGPIETKKESEGKNADTKKRKGRPGPNLRILRPLGVRSYYDRV